MKIIITKVFILSFILTESKSSYLKKYIYIQPNWELINGKITYVFIFFLVSE